MTHISTAISLLLAIMVFFGLWHGFMPVPAKQHYEVPVTARIALPVIHEQHWVSGNQTAETHSANIAIHGNRAFTVWYGGTEEGHADVALFLASLDLEDNQATWSAPTAIMNRRQSESGLNRYIRKVGNPAIHIWPDGNIGIYYVTVSFGGWAASTINYIESDNHGSAWSNPVRLVTSPFLNISTLVRTSANSLHDGSIELPVYHEFLGKFAETLRITRDQRIISKSRLSRGKHSLQPAVTPVSAEMAVAQIRYAGDPPNQLLGTQTADGGLNWDTPQKLPHYNPDAAVASLNLGNGRMILALNDLEDGRHRLSLAMTDTDNPHDWQIARVVEEASPGDDSHEFQFSYPSLARDERGYVHLVYTWNQTRIRHVKFSPAWLPNS